MKDQMSSLPPDAKEQSFFMDEVHRIWEGKSKPYCYVETLGCQQNENDSQRIRGMLHVMGYEDIGDPKAADVIVFNTCAVRENAEKKMFGKLGTLKPFKEEHPDAVLVVCGCMTQQEHIAKRISKTYRHVDILMGTHNIYRLPEYLYHVLSHRTNIREIEETDGYIVEGLPISREKGSGSAWVSIMYGCNNFCSYCVVPYVRGRERSRNVDEIVAECEALVASGVKEITLLGQNVNSYGKDREDLPCFAELLETVSSIPGLLRLRFMSSHPKDISDRVLSVMAERENICKSLHLPVQSGSNRVLHDMNRRYTREDYLKIIQKAREKMPEITFTTDIIVGFPSETQEDFEDTVSLLETVRYDMIFSFIYSKREGTPAAKLPSALPKERIQENFERMLKVQEKISEENSKKMIGSIQAVLVEGVSKNNPNRLSARTESNKLVNFEGSHKLIGKMIHLRIIDAGAWYLTGELIDEEKENL